MREEKYYGTVKESRFPPSLFAIYLVVLLLMSGVHTGLIVFMNRMGWNEVIQTIVPMIYWGMVAMALTLFTRRKTRAAYEEPMHKLAEATSRVANGDFSVYVPALHTQDKWDYLDVMIADFNRMVEELGSIEEAAMRLSNLISNILKLNKLENQRITPEVETYDVCRQLCECILQFEEAWDEKNIDLETEIEDKAMVEADESLLELVWNNLLSNAIKFTEPGGTVTVKQISEEGFVKISVSDTGCGMGSDVMNHIFDKFYQGDTSHLKEGNGLGLALVKRVLELLDGDIQVFSEEGRGSTFLVTLPAAGVSVNGDGGNL